MVARQPSTSRSLNQAALGSLRGSRPAVRRRSHKRLVPGGTPNGRSSGGLRPTGLVPEPDARDIDESGPDTRLKPLLPVAATGDETVVYPAFRVRRWAGYE